MLKSIIDTPDALHLSDPMMRLLEKQEHIIYLRANCHQPGESEMCKAAVSSGRHTR